MGPRSDERGNGALQHEAERLPLASMGPRSDERGNVAAEGRAVASIGGLQWGRALMNAEIPDNACRRSDRCNASMGPRSDERGNGRGYH